jgi:hypothetical protein
MAMIAEGPTDGPYKEFLPEDPGNSRSAGRLIVRSSLPGDLVSEITSLFQTLSSDALSFEPPFEVDPDRASIKKYTNQAFRNMFGVEIVIPEGHLVGDDYERVDTAPSTID